ncbi:hypothetical protein D3C80_1984090 [compost metagenome]
MIYFGGLVIGAYLLLHYLLSDLLDFYSSYFATSININNIGSDANVYVCLNVIVIYTKLNC